MGSTWLDLTLGATRAVRARKPDSFALSQVPPLGAGLERGAGDSQRNLPQSSPNHLKFALVFMTRATPSAV